jgi:hypothetical protein
MEVNNVIVNLKVASLKNLSSNNSWYVGEEDASDMVGPQQPGPSRVCDDNISTGHKGQPYNVYKCFIFGGHDGFSLSDS